MSKPEFTANRENSTAYFNALNAYMENNVLRPDKRFICEHEKACRESCHADGRKFHPGQLHHIGKYYDLKRNGKPFRIVVSGAEYGDESESVSIEDRTDDITCLQKCKPSEWNPHMRGTLILLQLLFGKEPENPSAGKEAMSIDVNGRSVNIFKAFSMPNFLLCSARKRNDKRPVQNNACVDAMRHNCAEHYKQTLEVIKPQIVILQGQRAWHYFSDRHNIQLDHANAKIEKIDIGGESVLVLPLNHPYQPNEKNWGGAGRHAIQNYVKPAVDNLLKEYEKIHG